MTIQNALLSAVRLPVLGMLFLLITAQMAAVVAAHRDGRRFSALPFSGSVYL